MDYQVSRPATWQVTAVPNASVRDLACDGWGLTLRALWVASVSPRSGGWCETVLLCRRRLGWT